MNFNNNKNDNKKNVNTKGFPPFYNREKDGIYDGSCLNVGYWNDNVHIKISPILPNPTDTKTYDYDHSLMTALTPEKALILLNGIEEKIIPNIGKDFSKEEAIPRIAVPVSNSLVQIFTYLPESEKKEPAIALFKNLDENTMQPESLLFYRFKSSMRIDDFDYKKGTFNKSDIQSELDLFVVFLRYALLGLSNAPAHSIRFGDVYFRDRFMETLNSIATKVGVPTSSSYYNKGSNSSFFNNKANESNVLPNTELQQIDEEELDNLMEVPF